MKTKMGLNANLELHKKNVQAAVPDTPDQYTKALLHLNGANGSTDILDSCGKAWQAYGNAQLDTSKYKFSPSSCALGQGSYIKSVNDSDDFYLNGDFTVECWVCFSTLPSVAAYAILAMYTNNNSRMSFFAESDAQRLGFSLYMNGGFQWTLYAPSVVLQTNIWYHYAVSRSSNDWYVFIDGVGNTANHAEIPDNQDAVYIGQRGDDQRYFIGNIDEIRISKGIARWTSNFTPPTSPYTS